MSAGIDYGMGLSNINHQTGIRYGVISQYDVRQAWADSSDADYGDPHCPVCGNAVQDMSAPMDNAIDETEDDYEPYSRYGCADYRCVNCCHTLDSSEVYGDEPLGYRYEDDGYRAECSGDNGFGIFVTESLFYTYARFCSPCAPGAGDLNSAVGFDGVKTYCFGHDWFDNGKAPYRVFKVSDNSEVFAEDK